MININNEEVLYEQIYQQLKFKIQNGELDKGTRLPSKRRMASDLGVSVNTIDNAYTQLVSEGYIESYERRGFFVCEIRSLLQISPQLAPHNFITSAAPKLKEQFIVDFSPTDIDLYNFPSVLWRKLLRQCFDVEDRTLLKRPPTQGNENLRRALQDYLYRSRGVNCTTDRIIIGAGTDSLLHLLSELFGGGTIALENPLHSNAYRIFSAADYQILPIPLDDKGLDTSYLPTQGATAVYVTPSHQFPMGISMPIGRRTQLLKWASETKSYIIEDDYDSEFRYNSRPIPSLQGMDQSDRVIYLGTFSKSVAPSLRVGYMVLPSSLLSAYNKRMKILGSFVSSFEQRLLNEFIISGQFEKHINRMRKIYRAKRELMLEELGKFKRNIKVLGDDAGQHVLIELSGKYPADVLCARAAELGVKVYPLSLYYIGRLPPLRQKQLLLGYGGLTSAQILQGMALLRKAFK